MAPITRHMLVMLLVVYAHAEVSVDDAATCSGSECFGPADSPGNSPVLTRTFSALQTKKTVSQINKSATGCDWCEKGLGWIGKTMMEGGADTDPHARNDPDIQQSIADVDQQKVGAAMIHAVTHDITSHKVHLCVLDIDKKDGVSSKFPLQCKLGVTCENCVYYKAEIVVGVSFCEGMSVEAGVGGSLMTPIPLSGPSTLKEIWLDVAPERNNDHANAFEEAVLETIATISRFPKYSTDAIFRFSGSSETGGGVGAKMDAKMGYNACDKSVRCWGVEIGVKLGVNYNFKAFVCIKHDQITVTAGMGGFAVSLDLKYVGGGGFQSRPTSSYYKSADDPPRCMLKPNEMSKRATRTDSLCPLLGNFVSCNAHAACYWGTLRHNYCFATLCWREKHRGQGDGWCPFNDVNGCLASDFCHWAARPCVRQPCKDFGALLLDYKRHGNKWSEASKCEWKDYPTKKTLWQFSGERE